MPESTYHHYQRFRGIHEHMGMDHPLVTHEDRLIRCKTQETLPMSRSRNGRKLLWLITGKRSTSHKSIGPMTDAENDFNRRDFVESQRLLNCMTAEFKDDVKALFDQHNIAQANLVDSSIDNAVREDIRLHDIHEHTRTVLPGSVRLIAQEICRLRTFKIKLRKTI